MTANNGEKDDEKNELPERLDNRHWQKRMSGIGR